MERRRTILGAGIVVSVIGLTAAIGVSSMRHPPAAAAPAPPLEPTTEVDSGPAIPEEPVLADDYELVDPGTIPSAGLEGVVPSLSDLPIPLTKRTMRYVAFFATEEKGTKTFREDLRRAARYRDHLERELLDADVPEDLLYLAAIESGFNPQATSPKGAAGMFQFMPMTAERFGLTVGDEIDERRSITKSGAAAIAYLKVLYATYGSWDLALAAYNCGEGRLDEAIEKANAMRGQNAIAPIAFHELAEMKLLPNETANFVPQIHAFAIVVHNRELLGLDDLDLPSGLRFAEIAVPAGTRLAPIAKAAGISIATLQEYNPDLLADRLPLGRGDYLVNVPEDALEQTLAALPALRARDEDREPAPAPKTRPRKTASAESKSTRAAATKEKKADAIVPKGEGSVATRPKKLESAPNEKGLFVLSNGLFVELHVEQRDDVEVGVTVEPRDPTKNRAKIGDGLVVSSRRAKLSELDAALVTSRTELNKVLLGTAARSLRTELASARTRFYSKTGFGKEFAALSDRTFPDGHPMHGALLVGPTETADDMFLELEPTWALRTTITLRGPLDPDTLSASLETAFADAFVPPKAASLAGSSRLAAGEPARDLVVGWSSPALGDGDEAAAHLAFLLACHERLGRVHRTLTPDKSSATRVHCSMELAPQASVAWVLVQPAAPLSIADAESGIDKAILALANDGPTEAELTSARQLLRVELARDRDTATIRGIPRARVIAENERILSKIDDVRPADIEAATKAIFSKDHRIVVTGGG